MNKKKEKKKEDEWGNNAIANVGLSKVEVTHLYSRIREDGRARKECQQKFNGKAINEVDFLAGAMSVLNALNILPPTYLMNTIVGKSIF